MECQRKVNIAGAQLSIPIWPCRRMKKRFAATLLYTKKGFFEAVALPNTSKRKEDVIS
jgi:hypothetical protein